MLVVRPEDLGAFLVGPDHLPSLEGGREGGRDGWKEGREGGVWTEAISVYL